MLTLLPTNYCTTPPKLYGQYLQRVGKQKWTKSKKSKKHNH